VKAVDGWKSQLAAWAIPPELLAAVPDSPYGWPTELWRRRSKAAEERGNDTPTLAIAHRLAGEGGSVLDIGAGTGRASLPLARLGHPLTAVERNPGMAAGFREESNGLEVRLIEGSWPQVEVTSHDLVMCAHVVYDVPEIGPFIVGMVAHARRGVVIELTETHPWSALAPYYRALHSLDRPARPTADDLVAVVRELTRAEPAVERWSRPPDLWFESMDEILELYRRRLVLPAERREELRRLLEPVVKEEDGRLVVDAEPRGLATISWVPG
jgi:SAM-dependent methyltransferase